MTGYPNYPNYSPQPGFPAQAPAMPGSPAPYGQPVLSGYPAAPGYPSAPPVAMGGMPGAGGIPAYNVPDEAQVRDSYRQHKEEMDRQAGGNRPQYLKFPGPTGQSKWGTDVYPGYESVLTVYLLPPWAPGKNVFRKVTSHFWKSYSTPRGTSVGCPGPECPICQARDRAMDSPDPMTAKRAKEFGRVRRQFLYNVALLDNINGHWHQASGQMRPFVLGAGALLHQAIGDLLEARGAANLVDPVRGRPLRLKKRKTGPNEMDVEYSVVDLDPQPLPAQFYSLLSALWDLDAEERPADAAQLQRAVQEMGLGAGAPMGASGYSPVGPGAPMVPPMVNPYPAVGSPMAPSMPPPAVSSWAVPSTQAPVMAAPPSFAPPSFAPPSFAPPMGAPPSLASPSFAPPSFAPPMGAPPMAAPPPVQSAPGAVDSRYQPQPSVPSMPGGVVPASVGALPGGRERCYGRCNPNDRYCQECPGAIRAQCEPLSRQGQASPGAPAQTLAGLSQQLRGS